MSVYIIVHKRVQLQEFKLLLEGFYHWRSETGIVGNENVEIRVRDRGHPEQDQLGDWQIDDSEDLGDNAIRADSR